MVLVGISIFFLINMMDIMYLCNGYIMNVQKIQHDYAIIDELSQKTC